MRIPIILLSMAIFVFYACEEEKDTEKPVVEIFSPSESDLVSGEIEITISANDNEKIDRVDLYIDFDLFETINGNQDYYRFDWDTDLGENGDYILTAKAYDDSDNSSETEPMTVTVVNYRNLLLTNKTMQTVDYEIDHEYGSVTGEILYLDTTTVRVPKNTTISLYCDHQFINSYCSYFYWEDEIQIDDIDDEYTLYVSDSYFYLFVATEWRVNFDWVTVNKDLIPESTYYTDIVNDGEFNILGYYEAGTNSNIYCYFDNDPAYEYWSLDPLYLPMVDHQYAMIGLYSDGSYYEYYDYITDDDIGGGRAQYKTAIFGTERHTPKSSTRGKIYKGLIINEPMPNIEVIKSSLSRNLKEFSNR